MIYCSINGQLINNEKASIPPQDRGFRYGDGVFETIAVHRGVPYQFEWHINRLNNGLIAIKISYDTTNIFDNCRRILQKNNINDGFLRIQVTRGIGSNGYLPTSGIVPTIVIETSPGTSPLNEPVILWKSTYNKISPRALPVQYKLCQGLNSTLARLEAAEHHCFDALLLNEKGQLCETSSGNIFWHKDGIIYTPSLACGILEGSTRAAMLRLCPDIIETEATIEQLTQAEAVCITNVAWKALAVEELLPGRQHWKSMEFAYNFTELLVDDRDNYCKSHRRNWQ